jgi:hypothetical protein
MLTWRLRLCRLVVQLRQPGVRERLGHGDTAPRVELQHSTQEVDRRRARAGEQPGEVRALQGQLGGVA